MPPEDPLRRVLHNEVHARPSARIRLPALIIDIAVLNLGVTRDVAGAHLQRLPGQADLQTSRLQDNFLHLRCPGFSVRWERHTEFSRRSMPRWMPPSLI